MAAGIPIVASAVGGVPEIIRHEDTGVLIPPGNPEAAARAVIDLMDDAPRRCRLGANARRFIETEYSLDAAATRLGAAYEELAQR
jgi:glycosyltransferase involved in cell wall biosynthesis